MNIETFASVPEPIYDQLPDPRVSDIKVAIDGLLDILGLNRQEFVPQNVQAISDALIEQTGIEISQRRDPLRIGKQVVGLMNHYPFLQDFPMRLSAYNGPLAADDLSIWIGNHVFDDYPGLFGISLQEGRSFRGFQQKIDKLEYYKFAKKLGLRPAR